MITGQLEPERTVLTLTLAKSDDKRVTMNK